jgi:predicted GIY-YIG superfamily endonuclease
MQVTATVSPGPEAEVNGDEPTALYRFYDRGNTLLYVGITVNLARRWEDHATEKSWWPGVARKTVQIYGTRREALAAETIAIIAESPVHNVAGQVPVNDRDARLRRLERRIADAEKSVRRGIPTVFSLDDGFQSMVDAYAKANGMDSDSAVGFLLRLGLMMAEQHSQTMLIADDAA